jgi:hypothetical protein
MRVRAVWWAAVLSIGFVGLAPCLAQQEPPNILVNGGFETGTTAPWGSWGSTTAIDVVSQCAGAAVPEPPIEGKYCLHVKISGPGTNFWDGGINQAPPTFQKGKKYTLSIWLKCKSGTAQINFKPEHGADPWEGFGEQVMTMTDKWAEYSITTPVFAADFSPASITLHTEFAAAEYWIDAARWYEGDYAPPAFLKQFSADNPSPAANATDVPRDASLGWKAGPFANTHNVFLGSTFEDVNNATVAKPLGVEVTTGLKETSFDPAGLLQYGKTYYWRVDEVNAPPDTSFFKGNVWSFTAEPYAYPITGVTVTASSANTNGGQTAAKTIDGSGLDAATGQHSNVDSDGWLTAQTSKLPAWIRYDFGQVYIIQQMKVWNSNQKTEPFIGFGAKSVLIESSVDGTTWTPLKTEEFAKADGSSTYTGFVVDMAGVQASSVRLTIQTNWSPFTQATGLSEVRFLSVPVQARQPSPAINAEGVPVTTGFDWREGRQAASHKVLFSTDRAAVANGTALVDTTTESSYQPPSLNFGSFYYWRVDEVNNAPVSDWPGNVWAFTTAEFAAIDDFEGYTNESPNRVFQSWIDGWGFSPDDSFPNGNNGNGTGALVGYDPSLGSIMETSITHGGVQSMPVEYNNVNAPYYSEIERTWASPQNLTTNGATDLSLWFRGNPAKFEQTNGHMVVSAYGGDIWGSADQFNFVYKKLSGDGTITAKVNSLNNVNVWSKAGVMIRDSLDASSTHGIMAVTPDGRRAFQNRPTVAGASFSAHSNTGQVTLPFWVKLERKGTQITASYSTNGTTWTIQPATENTGTDASPNPQTISMGANIYIGLAVSSNVPSTGAAIADFSDVVTSSSVTGQWQVADIGGENPANDPDQLYLVVQDSAGKSKTIVHPNAKATCVANWTQWLIPLKDITGVNMAAVKKMTIGVGSKSSPKASGGGMLYIDDIEYGRAILPVGLVAQYSMEDNANDSSGNGHNGTLMGDPTFENGLAGKGKAIRFNGAGGQYIDLGTFNPSVMTGKLSVALWANWKGVTGQYQGLMAKRNWWDPAQMMWQIEANNAAGAVTFSTNGSYPASGNPILPVGEWTHVAVTFDKTNAKFFINGSVKGQGAFSFGSNREASMHIGCCDSSGGNPFNGAIDEVRLYDVALTDAEVAALAAK